MCRLFYKNQHNVSNSSKHNILLRQAGKEVGFKDLFLFTLSFHIKWKYLEYFDQYPEDLYGLLNLVIGNMRKMQNVYLVFVFTPKCRINMNDFIFVSAKSKNYVRGETE